MGRRRQARENALHALYLADMAPAFASKAFDSVAGDLETDERTRDFSREIFEETLKRRDEIDEKIAGIAKNWSLARMTAVDRNLLRLAAYELVLRDDTPVKVVIDEAIEIARKFSTEDSTRFINGILDKLKELRIGPQKDPG